MKYVYIFLVLFPQLAFGQSHIGTDILNNKKSTTIPFEYINGMIVIEVNFGYLFNFNLIFDTGAANNIIFDKTYTDIINSTYSDTIHVYGADLTEKIDGYITRKVPLKLNKNPLIYRDFIALENYNEKIAASLGKNIHGILGGEFIKGLITTIDYKNKKIIFYDPNHYQPMVKPIPIKVINNKPYLITDIYINGTQLKELMLLDSGSTVPLILRNDNLPLKDNNKQPSYLGLGLSGEIYGVTHLLDSIKIGNDIYSNIKFSNQVLHDSIPVTIHTETGIIGGSILDNYIITIDYLRMKLYIEDINGVNPKEDKSGLVIRSIGPDFNTYIVSYVHDNSPAAAAGIIKGDEIIRYKWRPRIFTSLTTLRKKLSGRVGKTITLKMRRNEKIYKVKFQLKAGYKKNSPTN